jgi:hypothetical protein
MAAYAPTTHNVRQDIYSSIYTYIYIYILIGFLTREDGLLICDARWYDVEVDAGEGEVFSHRSVLPQDPQNL